MQAGMQAGMLAGREVGQGQLADALA